MDREGWVVWSEFQITTLPEGRASIVYSTNDDNDDGYPDSEVTFAHWETSMETALKMSGRYSHKGIWGHDVKVFIDGKENIKQEGL